MNNKYLKAINESLELNHLQNEKNTLMIQLVKDNLILEIKNLQYQLQEVEDILSNQERVNERYKDAKSNQSINITGNEVVNFQTSQDINAQKVVTASKIDTVNL